ncbi:MAG: hypothetical protein ACK6EB_13335, partial [Planctomyces sp.]
MSRGVFLAVYTIQHIQNFVTFIGMLASEDPCLTGFMLVLLLFRRRENVSALRTLAVACKNHGLTVWAFLYRRLTVGDLLCDCANGIHRP